MGSLQLETGIILLPGKITRKSCLLRAKKPTEFTDEHPLRFNSLRFTLTSLSPGCPLSVSSCLCLFLFFLCVPFASHGKTFCFPGIRLSAKADLHRWLACVNSRNFDARFRRKRMWPVLLPFPGSLTAVRAGKKVTVFA